MGNWNVIKSIDQGGFGKIYEVKSEANQRGALKELKHLDVTNVKRFEREIALLRSFNHQHIIKILDSNLAGNPPKFGPWYVMEYMEGGSLKNLMNSLFSKNQLFARKWAISTVILPVVNAVSYAHSQRVYHRDLKPENLLFTTSQQSHLKVADWGIGKDINRNSIALTVGGIGTPGYCAPEQWFDLDIDGRTDIYSLGVIFYQLMTGHLPPLFDNRNQRATVPRPSYYHNTISSQLDNIILKMIELNPNNRFKTMNEVKDALTLMPNVI